MDPKPKHFIEWVTIPWGQSTKDDPLGQRGYFGWKLIYRGKQYGQVILLTAGGGKSFDEQCEDAKPIALLDAAKVMLQVSN